jgi:hypothetical protein
LLAEIDSTTCADISKIQDNLNQLHSYSSLKPNHFDSYVHNSRKTDRSYAGAWENSPIKIVVSLPVADSGEDLSAVCVASVHESVAGDRPEDVIIDQIRWVNLPKEVVIEEGRSVGA